MDDLHDLLRAGDRFEDLLSQSALAHRGDELLRHLEVHVRLEQRDADVAQGLLEVGLGHARAAAELLEGDAELVGELFEHL